MKSANSRIGHLLLLVLAFCGPFAGVKGVIIGDITFNQSSMIGAELFKFVLESDGFSCGSSELVIMFNKFGCMVNEDCPRENVV